MPFGKFKDRKLSEVPLDYLLWCIDSVKFKSPKLKEAIELEILERESEEDYFPDYEGEDDYYT